MTTPLTAWKGGLILAEFGGSARARPPWKYVYFDPATGERAELWESPPGRQEVAGGMSGNVVITVEIGVSLPFADWRLLARDLDSGVVTVLAEADMSLLDPALALRPDLPYGFAPLPRVSQGRVVWDELYATPSGAVGQRVQVLDLATKETRTVTSTENAALEVLRLPVIAGTTVAWIHKTYESVDATAPLSRRVELLDIETGSRTRLDLPGRPWQIALSASGRWLYWDDDLQRKLAVDLESGDSVVFYEGIATGVVSEGDRATWVPVTGQPTIGGFYDPHERRVWTFAGVPDSAEGRTTVASIFGTWFVWNEIATIPVTGGNDETDSFLYFKDISVCRDAEC